MKTSNKLFLAAVALLLGSLVTYDTALSAVYRTGNYKKPFYGYTAMPLTGFSEVAVPSSSRFSIKIVGGPYAVHINDDATKYVHITQQGQRLTVALAFPKEDENLGHRETVVISCPQLRQLTTDAPYTIDGKRGDGGGNITIEGLKQDSLLVSSTRSSSVHLVGNTLGQLRAVVVGKSSLFLEETNRIQAADLTVGPDCELNQQCGIPQPHYQFANTATAHFEGPAAYGLGTKSGQ